MRYLLALVLIPALTGPAQANFWANWHKCRKGDGQPALDACNWLMKSDKLTQVQRPWVIVARGYLLRRAGKNELAAADFTEALKSRWGWSQRATIHNNRGNAFRALRQYKKALADYRIAVRLDPKSPIPYNNRGIAYRDLNQYKKAIANFNAALRLDPKNARAFYNRGLVYTDLKQHEQAVADYSRAIGLNPKFAAAYYNRGFVYETMGRRPAAIKDYQAAYRLAPKNPGYRQALQRLGIAP